MSIFGKYRPPAFCKGCGRPVVLARVLDFDRYDRATGEPVKPKVTHAAICDSGFDTRRRSWPYESMKCDAVDIRNGHTIGHTGPRGNRLLYREDPT